MEQAQRGVSEDAALASRERAEPIGAYLARQRVLRGITLEQLADTTRIPIRSLARLEAGVFDAEPDGFARGFVRTVARALGLPPDETVARMLPEASQDDRHRGRLLIWLRRGFAAATVLLFILLAVWAVTGHRLLPSSWNRNREELLHRHDAIRALAEEQIEKNADPVENRPLDGP
jgi:transcriptional regulator with XRE-family HTH domain